MQKTPIERLQEEADDVASWCAGALVERELRLEAEITECQAGILKGFCRDEGSEMIWEFQPGDAAVLWECMVDDLPTAGDAGGSVNEIYGLAQDPPWHFAEMFLVAGHLLATTAGSWLRSEVELQRIAACEMLIYAFRCWDFWTDARGPKNCRNPTDTWKRMAAADVLFQTKMFQIRRTEENSERGRANVAARYDGPGGNRDRIKELKEIWLSGKYTRKDDCATAECDRLHMSWQTARNHLKGLPGH